MAIKNRNLRSGQDSSTTGIAQSGPNRGANTGTPSPGGIAGSTKAGAAKRGGTKSSSPGGRKGPVVISGASKGAVVISGTNVGGRAQKG
jgi:hypothetical protein